LIPPYLENVGDKNDLKFGKILCAIFDPMFLPCSYGFRPDQNCHKALRALKKHTHQNSDGAIVEIDIRKYFNSVPHEELIKCLRKRISDRRLLRLINVLIRTPSMVDGQEIENKVGVPQGSTISPVLANLYLHYVIDVWFAEIGETHMKGRTAEVRYADDMVFIFQYKQDAERFFEVLPKRLKKYGLELHLDKSQLIESGSRAAMRANRNETCLSTYTFLGFRCYWGRTKYKTLWRLKFASRGDRLRATLKRFREFLWDRLNTPNTNFLLQRVKLRVRG
jgi:RNA-directed DNA polymerase